MSFTTEQKSDLVFKKLLTDKSTTSVLTKYFEELITARRSILLSDVWTQSNLIPTTAGEVVGIVEEVVDLVMVFVPGQNSRSFYHSTLKDVIPFNHGDGSYLYTLKKNNNTPIPFGLNDWYLDPESGVLTFFGDFPTGVSDVLPPKISCFKYIGSKGDFTAASVAPTVETFNPTLGQTLFILGAAPSYISEVTVNGIEAEPTVEYTIAGANFTWLNTNYSLDPDDILTIEYYL